MDGFPTPPRRTPPGRLSALPNKPGAALAKLKETIQEAKAKNTSIAPSPSVLLALQTHGCMVPFGFPSGTPSLRMDPIMLYAMFGLIPKGCNFIPAGDVSAPKMKPQPKPKPAPKEPTGKDSRYNTGPYWEYFFSKEKKAEDKKMLKPKPARACPLGFVPKTSTQSVNYGNTIYLKRPAWGQKFEGKVQVGTPPATLPVVFHTGKTLTWFLDALCKNKGTENKTERLPPASISRRPMPSPCEVRVHEGKNPKPGGGQVVGMLVSDVIRMGPRVLGRAVFCDGITAQYSYPHETNYTGMIGLGKMVDMPIALPALPLWPTLWLNYFKQLMEIVMKIPQFWEPLPPPDETFSFYHGDSEGCFIQAGYDDRYMKGPIQWWPASHGITSWTINAIAGISVNGTELPFCKPFCSAAVHTGQELISGPPAIMYALIEATQASPICAHIDELPNVTFTLTTGRKVTFGPWDYVRTTTVMGELRCIGAWYPQPPATFSGDVIVLGLPFLRKQFAIFDGKQGRVGLAEPRHDYFAVNKCKAKGSAKKVVGCIPLIPPIVPGLLGAFATVAALGLVAAVLAQAREAGLKVTPQMAKVALHATGKNVAKAVKMIKEHYNLIKEKAAELKKLEDKKREEDLIPWVLEKLRVMGEPYESTTRPMAGRALEVTNDHIMNAVTYIMKNFYKLQKEAKADKVKPKEDLIPFVVARVEVTGFKCSRALAARGLQYSGNVIDGAVEYVIKNYKRLVEEVEKNKDKEDEDQAEKCEDKVAELMARAERIRYETSKSLALSVLQKHDCDLDDSVKYIMANYDELKKKFGISDESSSKSSSSGDAEKSNELRKVLAGMGFDSVPDSVLAESLKKSGGNVHQAVYHALNLIRQKNLAKNTKFKQLEPGKVANLFRRGVRDEAFERSRERVHRLQAELGVEKDWEPAEFNTLWEPGQTYQHFAAMEAEDQNPLSLIEERVRHEGGSALEEWKAVWRELEAKRKRDQP